MYVPAGVECQKTFVVVGTAVAATHGAQVHCTECRTFLNTLLTCVTRSRPVKSVEYS